MDRNGKILLGVVLLFGAVFFFTPWTKRIPAPGTVPFTADNQPPLGPPAKASPAPAMQGTAPAPAPQAAKQPYGMERLNGKPAPAPEPPAPPPPPDKDGVVTLPSGLKYVILQQGAGNPARPGQQVQVLYTGSLEDGTVFDSTASRNNEPLPFPLGRGVVIKGWDEGVTGMKPGEKRKLIIPPDLGYGDKGAGGVIPPNATLVFEIELLSAE